MFTLYLLNKPGQRGAPLGGETSPHSSSNQDMTNVLANTQSGQEKLKTGKKKKTKQRRKDSSNNGGGSNKITIEAKMKFGVPSGGSSKSDFGFDIEGINTPTHITSERDSSLFINTNKDSKWGIEDNPSENLPITQVSNLFKSVEIKFDPSPDSTNATLNAWYIIWNDWNRDVIRNTNGNRGAITAFERQNVQNYLDKVIRAFDVLCQLEVMLGWSPSDSSHQNNELRRLAAKASETIELLSFRNDLRDVLKPYVLPPKVMLYIRWLREYKLSNSNPQSPKLAFSSSSFDLLKYQILNVTTPQFTDFKKTVEVLVNDVRDTEPALIALLRDKVDCTQFADVKDYYGPTHNSAVYDPLWLDVYNNLPIYFNSVDTGVDDYKYPNAKSQGFGAFIETPPSLLAVANCALQIKNEVNGMPLVKPSIPKIKILGDKNFWSTTAILSKSNAYKYDAIESWFKFPCDSVHIPEDGNKDRSKVKFSSRAKGIAIDEYYLGLENAGIAQKQSLCALMLD